MRARLASDWPSLLWCGLLAVAGLIGAVLLTLASGPTAQGACTALGEHATGLRMDSSHALFLPISVRMSRLSESATAVPAEGQFRATPTPVGVSPPMHVYTDCVVSAQRTEYGSSDVTQVQTDTYGADSELLTTEIDAGADGRLDYVSENRYSARGQLVATIVDWGADGKLDIITMTSYDRMGRALRSTTYDIELPGMELINYSYDGDGYLVFEHLDYESDGVVDRVYRHEYDDSGERVRTEICEEAGLDCRWIIRVFDRDGIVTRVVFGDGGSDGQQAVEFEYDSMGRLVWEHDIVDGRRTGGSRTYEYGAAGWLVHRTRYRQAGGGVGLPHNWTTYRYDVAGRLVEFRNWDEHGVGLVSTYVNSCR